MISAPIARRVSEGSFCARALARPTVISGALAPARIVVDEGAVVYKGVVVVTVIAIAIVVIVIVIFSVSASLNIE